MLSGIVHGLNNDNRQLTNIDCISKRTTAGLVSAVGCLSRSRLAFRSSKVTFLGLPSVVIYW